MVDVGYFIDGRHGVIRSVWSCANSKTSDMHVTYIGDDGEVYVLKYEDIEYVIPHEKEVVANNETHGGKIVFDKDGVTEYGTDGSVIMKGRYVENKNLLPPKPMTNAEKFKEVFGFEPIKESLCELFGVDECKQYTICQGCPLEGHCEWGDPYVKKEVED